MRRLALAFVLAATPASAQPLRDLQSGLSITAPPGYVAAPAPTMEAGNTRAVFDIRRPGEIDTGCRVSTVNAPANAFLSQAELNARAAAPEYQRQMAGALSQIYDLVAVNVVGSTELTGLAVIGDIREAQGRPTQALRVRSLLVFFDTPLQRVFLACVAERDAFEARFAEFEAVLNGLEIP